MVIINDLNIKKQAEELGVSVWQAPSFLFAPMGAVIISAMTAIYFISRNNASPEILIFSESAVVLVLFAIGSFIIKNMEQMALMNKMKSDFVSIASHQLKTPPTEISWEIELLLKEYENKLDNRQMEAIRSISAANKRVIKITNDLLDVARVDQGRFVLNKEKINILEIIANVVKDNEVLAQAGNVKIEFLSDETLPEITGDKKRIAVVVDNFITNAIKYAKENGQINIEAKKDGDRAVVSVRDNGIGIPLHQQDKIFGKFFRSDNVAKYNTDGSGLGLYISKKIIESSGGKIWFKSKEGEGSMFSFALPLEAVREKA